MTKDEFDNLDSDRKYFCPKCGLRGYTQPYPNCGCPISKSGYGTRHINKYHHNCEDAKKRHQEYLQPFKNEYEEFIFLNMI